MNEVKRCSISGISFTLTTEAYDMLSNYIASLDSAYGKEQDGQEIIADIEARIAELILSTQENTRVVERPLVANIIARMGSAEDISEESDGEEGPQHAEPRIPRRLYRDLSNSRLGGVCAGIARYFDLDPSVTRLAATSPLLLMALSTLPGFAWLFNAGCSLFCVMVITYIVMWFAIPAAKSPRQKLEMNGERITVQAIRENAAAKDADNRARSTVAEAVTYMSKALIIILKALGVLVAAGLAVTVVALITGMCVIYFADDSWLNGFGGIETVVPALRHSALPLLGISLCLIPVVFILYILLCLIAGRKTNRTAMIIMVLLWTVNLIALPVTAIKAARFDSGRSRGNSCLADEHLRLADSIDIAAANYILPEAEAEEERQQ